MGKYALILVAGFISTFGFVKRNLDRVDALLADNLVEQFEQREAKMIANGLANMSLAALSDSAEWRAGYASVGIGGGTGWAELEDSTTADHEVRITTSGSSGGAQSAVEVLARLAMGMPPAVRGGVTANSEVKTLGGLTVDGRNHDMDGNLLLGAGTLGISTTQTYDQGGASVGGGTSGGVDYVPSSPADPAIIEEGVVWDFPANPDEVFKFSPGWLKEVALSGKNGSQYVTNPADLSFPLSGVTYVELPNNGNWIDVDFGDSSGLLVVHNQWTNATIKNLNTGTFKGLIIADDVDKIHCDIIGAVIVNKSTGNCIGNGNGRVLFSGEAVEKAALAAMGGRNVKVVYWHE